MELIVRLRQFIEQEGKFCSIDICGITPEYVYRMWGGSVAIEEIATTMEALRPTQGLERSMIVVAR